MNMGRKMNTAHSSTIKVHQLHLTSLMDRELWVSLEDIWGCILP